jgi:glutamate-ammonia-ligase adenylyltransferase
VDLLVFYETDDGAATHGGAGASTELHEYFTRVTQRFIATLDDDTPDGRVWRVDMRLRPEGTRGPLVNSLAAAERYYEAWGRTWERAALVRARPVAGDLGLGERLLRALSPFVWRRAVDPGLAGAMIGLVEQARAELGEGGDGVLDLKIGEGGIREAEFFVQSLQLVWGGVDAKVRGPSTLPALRKLRARGFVTDREAREVEAAYLLLRRLEHRVQTATGLQTHALPTGGELLSRVARSLGFGGSDALLSALAAARSDVHRALESLRPAPEAEGSHDLDGLFAALDSGEDARVLAQLDGPFARGAPPDLARHLLALARRPDAPLGAMTRERLPHFVASLLRAMAGSADPEQAARFMARFFARLSTPSVYARALGAAPERVPRMANLFGASAFLAEVLVGHPELADRVLFGSGVPDVPGAARAVDEEIRALSAEDARDPDAFVGALRRAKRSVLLEVGLADLAEDLEPRDCRLVLSALADATLDRALAFAARERGHDPLPLAVIAMGKLGGREIGYGSDLDLLFAYEGDDAEPFVRVAQRVLRLVGAPHGEGPGYELDTRLRPSGNQGLLVVSVDAFARYHGLIDERSATASQGRDWERQALVKARLAAGSAAVGDALLAFAHEAAYELGAPKAEELDRLRARMERELGGERRAEASPGASGARSRYDLKLGRGGLVDVEFAVQWLQMKHGQDRRVRTSETEAALAALETAGYLDPALAAPLRDGYVFLRRLEQRLRVLHGGGAQLLEDGAPGLPPLARRMGLRDQPQRSACDALLARYRAVTEEVRAAYRTVLGLG